jgi:hypothetical protein
MKEETSIHGKWLLQLAGDPVDLEELATRLVSGEVTILKKGTQYFLSASAFQDLSGVDEVRENGIRLLASINGIAKLYGWCWEQVQESGIYFEHDDGHRDISVLLHNDLKIRCRLLPPTITGGVSAPPPYEAVRKMVLDQIPDKRIALVLDLWGSDSKWATLYKIFKCIEEDIGETNQQKGWITKADAECFTRTANSTAIGKEARHASFKFEPPRDPMTHQKATDLIAHLLEKWLEYRAKEP